MITHRLFLALAVVSAATACSKPDAGGTSGAPSASAATTSRLLSCDRITAASVCSEYTGAYLAQNEAVITASCQKLGGTFAYAECPNSTVLGTCTLATGEMRKFFGSGGASYDAARAQKECETSYRGKWAAFR